MNKTNEDLDGLISTLEKMNLNPDDDKENRHFSYTHAAEVSELLQELKEWRESATRTQAASGRIIIEGYDEESTQGAFADALNKASHFFNEQQDVSITVLGLTHLPKGGHRARLEIDVTPLSVRLTEQPDGLDVQLKKEKDIDFKKTRKKEDENIKELVHNHFLETAGTVLHVPDYFLINFKDADLLNQMIEKQFFGASHEIEKEEEELDQSEPKQVSVRVIKKDK